MIALGLILLPLFGGAAAWAVGARRPDAARWVSLLAIGADGLLLAGAAAAPASGSGVRVALDRPWLADIGVRLHLAADDLSLVLLALTLSLGGLAVLCSWSEVRTRVGFFHFNLLWVLAGIAGVFLARDLFLFYFCWELMLVPMTFLISGWGHERRVQAALKFFLFTQAGGLLMLLSSLALYLLHGSRTGTYTFDAAALASTPLSPAAGMLIMLGFFAGFGVKLPVFILHPWLPDAHTEAPTGGSLILAGLLLKTGAYGMLRFLLPLFPGPARAFAPVALALAVAGIAYGALLALAQTDLKRMVAYTSVSHMGFVLLGLFSFQPLAAEGVVLQMVCHGLSTGGLFVIAGLLQERLHTRDLAGMGALWARAPRLAVFTLIFALASLGLPGLGNFVAEFMILFGAFHASPAAVALAAVGLVLAMAYSLRLAQRLLFAAAPAGSAPLPDLRPRECLVLALLAAGLLWLGLYPRPLVRPLRPVVAALIEAPPPAVRAPGGLP